VDEIQEDDPDAVGSEEQEEVVISHVVLFRPRPNLTADQRQTLVTALKSAVDGIVQIRRATIGKRLFLDRPGYEEQMAEHYEYSAILEFDSETDLRAYLDHPAHDLLGKLLFTSAEAVLAYDYAALDVDELLD
jgi:hypothetical protein